MPGFVFPITYDSPYPGSWRNSSYDLSEFPDPEILPPFYHTILRSFSFPFGEGQGVYNFALIAFVSAS